MKNNKLYTLITVFVMSSMLVACTSNSNSKVAENHLATEKTENQSEDVAWKDNTKKFEAVDISKLNPDEVIEAKSDVSFASKCQTMDEIYETAQYIIKGTVHNTYFTVIDGLAYTVVDLKTSEVLKGDLEQNAIHTIVMYGGYMTIQQEVDAHDNAFRFEQIDKSKWNSTYVEKKLLDSEYPEVGDEYVMAIMEDDVLDGAYALVNEYETLFKKNGDTYSRDFPMDKYFDENSETEETHFEKEKSFDYSWFKNQCKKMKKKHK